MTVRGVGSGGPAAVRGDVGPIDYDGPITVAEPAGVSRGTLAQSGFIRRSYDSPVRQRKSAATEHALIEAALIEMQHGRFRPTAKVITLRAGYTPASINQRFGSIDLMRRRLAREHWEVISSLAGLGRQTMAERKRLVWLIMTGAPEPDLP